MIPRTILILGACTAMAHAAMVDVAFYNSGFGGTQPVGPAVLGQAGDQWNWVDGAACPSCPGPIALVNTAGVATGASMSFVSQGAIVSANTGTQPVPNLTDNYLFDNSGGSITVALSGLAPNSAFELV